MEQILTIIIKILAALAVGGIAVVVPKIRTYFNEKIGTEKTALLVSQVQTFVIAADQLLKAEDPDGTKRKAYVIQQLDDLGVEVDAYVNALIEEQVVVATESDPVETKTTKKKSK